eukprot:5903286-Alexandrium_andersonii.AAC.1
MLRGPLSSDAQCIALLGAAVRAAVRAAVHAAECRCVPLRVAGRSLLADGAACLFMTWNSDSASMQNSPRPSFANHSWQAA